MASNKRGPADVRAEARQKVAAARLADPEEHFPYKQAEVAKLLKANPAMGPDGPGDTTVQAEDFLTTRIAEATAAYIDAQAAFLADPSPANRSGYDARRDDLIAARRTHRRTRVDPDGNPVANVVGMTPGAPDHLRGPRFRRAGEE